VPIGNKNTASAYLTKLLHQAGFFNKLIVINQAEKTM
jgi:hypothetical protein